MIYGYVRVSTKKQNIDRQIKNIAEHSPTAKIFTDKYTGTTTNRPNWLKLLQQVKDGDTIIFDSVSRMSRNADEGIATYFSLLDKGVNLIFLKEQYINTATYKEAMEQQINETENEIANIYIEATNKVLKLLATQQIRIAFEQAEKEVQDLRQRTSEGMRASNAPQKISEANKGRPKTTKKSIKTKEIIKAMSKDFNGTKTDVEIIAITQIAKNTFYKYKSELKAELDSQAEEIEKKIEKIL